MDVTPLSPPARLPANPPTAKDVSTSEAIRPVAGLGQLHKFIRAVARPLFVPELWIRLQMWRAELDSEMVELPMGRLHTWVGEPGKPALLLLHGFGSDAAWQWHSQVVALSRHFRLFVPDLLYFGKSEGHRDDFSLECQGEACLAMLDRFGITRAHVAGISFGGLVACDLASRYPDRFDRVVISNSSGPEYRHEDHEATLEHFGISHMNDLLIPERPEDIRRLLSVAWHRPPPVPSFALEEAFQIMFSRNREEQAETMRQLVGRIESPEFEERTIEQEVLLLWGEHDRVFTVDVAKRLRARAGKRAKLHVIADTAHSPNQERGDEYNRVMVRFLRGKPLLSRRAR